MTAANLEQLDTDGGEHELEQERDEHDVVDGANSDHHTLNHVLIDVTHTHTPDPPVFLAKTIVVYKNRINSNQISFAQNTSHLNAASGKSS